MNNERTGLYEGMFLFPQSATANLQDAIDHLKDILSKVGATIINFRKWDDRRLAYEIDGNKRGVYFLVYFNAPTSSMSELERRCNQSEHLLRMMVTRAEHVPTETIEANEGADDLATEIKLRGEKKTEKGASTGSKVSKKEDKPAPEPPQKATKVVEEVVEAKTVESEEVVETKTAEPEEVVEAKTAEPEEVVEAKTAEPEEVLEAKKAEPEAVVAEETTETTETEEVTEA
jgi:small subunit ribosomal protein S6